MAIFIPTQVKRVYQTTFPDTENPISQGGIWINGATTGVNWKDMKQAGGIAYGPANYLSTTYDDATAILAGAWRPDHQATAVVKLNATQSGGNYQEVEVRLRTTITANQIKGYEVLWRANHDGSQYHQIGHWFGPIGVPGGCALGCAFGGVPGSLHYDGNGMEAGDNVVDTVAANAAWGSSHYGGIYDGDTVGASIVGNRIRTWVIHNSITVLLQDFNDTAGAGSGAYFTSGAPGMGHWHHSSAGDPADFGFTSFAATEV